MREKLKIDIRKMKARHVGQVSAIARECNLSYWSEEDYKNETTGKDSIALIALSNENLGDEKIIGFIIAHLITIQDSLTQDNPKNNSKNNKDNFPVTASHKVAKTTKQTRITPEQTRSNAGIAEIEIYNIGVASNYQRNGIGKRLLSGLIEAAAQYSRTTIWLEVRESNAKAIDFYKANGFDAVFKRKNFYTHPPEDAVIMKLQFGKLTESNS